jgi:YD repeat-containing protein
MKIHISFLTVFAGLAAAIQTFAQTGNDNPTGVAGVFNGNVTTGCSYDPYTGNATRTVIDVKVTGSVSQIPLVYGRTYNSRTGKSLGSYDWSVTDTSSETQSPTQPLSIHTMFVVSYPDGREILFSHNANDPETMFRGPKGVKDRWRSDKDDPQSFTLLREDGSQVRFVRSSRYYYRAVALIDPNGLRTTLSRPSDGVLVVTEPAGRWIRIDHTPTTGPAYVVKTSDGQTAEYYENLFFTSGGKKHRVLTRVKYDDGTSALYGYQDANTSNRARPLLYTCDDVRFEGPMRRMKYEFKRGSGAIYGQIFREKHIDGTIVSEFNQNTHVEKRGDGPTRSFTYADKRLTRFTDFQGNPKTIDYDNRGFVRRVTDPSGKWVAYDNEPVAGRVVTQTHSDGTKVTFTYSDSNNPYYLTSYTNELGKTIHYRRDASNRVIRIEYPGGMYPTCPWEKFEYNDLNQVTAHQFTSYEGISGTCTGGKEIFNYNAAGQLMTTVDALENVTRYEYTNRGFLKSVKDAQQNITTLTYNSRGQILRTTFPDAKFVENVYDDQSGVLLRTTDERSNSIDYQYDPYRRLIKQTQSVAGSIRTTEFSYDDKDTHNALTHTDFQPRLIKLPSGVQTRVIYDRNLRKISEISAPETTEAAGLFGSTTHPGT